MRSMDSLAHHVEAKRLVSMFNNIAWWLRWGRAKRSMFEQLIHVPCLRDLKYNLRDMYFFLPRRTSSSVNLIAVL